MRISHGVSRGEPTPGGQKVSHDFPRTQPLSANCHLRAGTSFRGMQPQHSSSRRLAYILWPMTTANAASRAVRTINAGRKPRKVDGDVGISCLGFDCMIMVVKTRRNDLSWSSHRSEQCSLLSG